MKTQYLITNNRQGTWGRGDTIRRALKKCHFTASQDEVDVFIVSPGAQVNEFGAIRNRFLVHLGKGKVRSDKKRIALELTGDSPETHSTDEQALDAIHEALDGLEWEPHTLDHVADLVRSTGRAIRDPEED